MLEFRDILTLAVQFNHDLLAPLSEVLRKADLIKMGLAGLPTTNRKIELERDLLYISKEITALIADFRALRDIVGSMEMTSEAEFLSYIRSFSYRTQELLRFSRGLDVNIPGAPSYIPEKSKEMQSAILTLTKMLRALTTLALIGEPSFIQTNFAAQARIAADTVSALVSNDASDIRPEFVVIDQQARGFADQGMVQAIFINLFLNSIKYRSIHNSPVINVNCRPARNMDVNNLISCEVEEVNLEKWVNYISVEDNGIGIKKEICNLYFVRIHRSGPPESRCRRVLRHQETKRMLGWVSSRFGA